MTGAEVVAGTTTVDTCNTAVLALMVEVAAGMLLVVVGCVAARVAVVAAVVVVVDVVVVVGVAVLPWSWSCLRPAGASL